MTRLEKLKAGEKKLSENQLVISISAAFLGLIAGTLLIFLLGNDPFTAFAYLFKGGFMNLQRIGNSLATATTLFFAGLSISVAFKTGLFNIGASGQMLMGGLFVTYVALNWNLPRPLMLIVLVVAAISGGALWGAVSGLLKAFFHVNEVVSTILMNWIAYWIVYYAVQAYFKSGLLEIESRSLPSANTIRAPWLSNIFGTEYINYGIFLCIITVIVIGIILDKTTLGFELKAVGYNKSAAEYAGIKVNNSIIISMVMAGALSGLAGLTYYAGYSVNMQVGVMPSQGFDGIAVALLGAGSSLGIALSSMFFAVLHVGKGFMTANTSVPPEIADTIIAVIIYFTATSLLLKRFWEKLERAAFWKKFPVISIKRKKDKILIEDGKDEI